MGFFIPVPVADVPSGAEYVGHFPDSEKNVSATVEDSGVTEFSSGIVVEDSDSNLATVRVDNPGYEY